jgi:hypothetical protein
MFEAPKSQDDRFAKRGPPVEIEQRLVRFSHLMDTLFRVPILGWRFGLNTIIDLIPGIGDTATSIVCLYIIVSAVRYRVPKLTLFRMGVNTAIYYVGGMAPLVGDLFDTWWKPNRRNLELLRRSAMVSAEDAHGARVSDLLFLGVILGFLLALLFGSLVLTYFALRSLLEGMNFQVVAGNN